MNSCILLRHLYCSQVHGGRHESSSCIDSSGKEPLPTSGLLIRPMTSWVHRHCFLQVLAILLFFHGIILTSEAFNCRPGSFSTVFNHGKVAVAPISSRISSRSNFRMEMLSDVAILPSQPEPSTTVIDRVFKAANIVYRFSRPHTIKGTILASFMGVVRALLENPTSMSLKLIPRALIGLFALLCGNAYIVGINQIYDIKIDEVTSLILFLQNVIVRFL